jgi:hypothetical protein
MTARYTALREYGDHMLELLQIALPLLGAVLGSVLFGIGVHFKARQERSRLIASALSDLLEVRHRPSRVFQIPALPMVLVRQPLRSLKRREEA